MSAAYDDDRMFSNYILGHRPQPEYVVHYPAERSLDHLVTVALHVALAIAYERPLYFLVHHTATLPDGFRRLATIVESYGSDGDSEEAATARLLRRIESDRLRKKKRS